MLFRKMFPDAVPVAGRGVEPFIADRDLLAIEARRIAANIATGPYCEPPNQSLFTEAAARRVVAPRPVDRKARHSTPNRRWPALRDSLHISWLHMKGDTQER